MCEYNLAVMFANASNIRLLKQTDDSFPLLTKHYTFQIDDKHVLFYIALDVNVSR